VWGGPPWPPTLSWPPLNACPPPFFFFFFFFLACPILTPARPPIHPPHTACCRSTSHTPTPSGRAGQAGWRAAAARPALSGRPQRGPRCCRPALLPTRALAPGDEEGGDDAADAPDALNAEWRDLLGQLDASHKEGPPPPPPLLPYTPATGGTPFHDAPPPAPAGFPGLGAWAWPPPPGQGGATPSSASASAGGGAVDDTWDWGDGEGYTPFGAAAGGAPATGPPALGDGWWCGGEAAASAVPSASPSPGPADAAAAASSAAAPAAAALAQGATARDAAGSPSPWDGAARAVYVILFGVGSAETEGIYSLRACRAEDGLPHDTIVAFERAADAARYAGRLEAAMAHAPAVCGISPGELLDFCADAGYAARLEPAGSPLAPPACNVGLTDWERSVRLRGGQWSVLPADPVRGQEAAGSEGGGGGGEGPCAPSSPLPPHPFGSLTNNAGAYSGAAASPCDGSSLDELRARLERAWAADG